MLLVAVAAGLPLTVSADVEEVTEEIQGTVAGQIDKSKEQIPIKKIEEVPDPLKEIPQPLQERGMSGSDEIRLEDIEQKKETGATTAMEHDLEKDALSRKSNIQF